MTERTAPRLEIRRILTSAAAYFALVFLAGFLLGTIRVLFLLPRVGELYAGLLELPVILWICWLSSGVVMRRWGGPWTAKTALAMGALAFAMLMAAEVFLATVVFDMQFRQYLARLTTLAGLLGLGGQVLYGLFPLLRASHRRQR